MLLLNYVERKPQTACCLGFTFIIETNTIQVFLLMQTKRKIPRENNN